MSPRGRRRTEVETPPRGPEGDEIDLEDEEDDAERARLGDLVALADSTFADYTWHVFRQRSPEDMARTRSRQQSVFATTITGPIDMTQLRATVGGGLFTLWGYLGGKLTRKIRFEMEGPPIFYAPPSVAQPAAVPPAGTAPQPTPNGTDPVLLGVLQSILKSQEAIVAKPAPPSGFSFREVLALSSALGNRSSNGIEMKDLVALFQQGIEIGGNAVGGNEKGTLEIVLEKGIPALEKIAIAMSRRPQPRPPGAPPRPRPGPASSATVIEDPNAPPVSAPVMEPNPPELTDEQKAEAMRWNAAVDALARAIADGTDPDDFADTLDHLLLPSEIDLMVMGSTRDVITQLRTAADRYPILNEPAAEAFVDRVLASLRDPNPDPNPAL